MLYVVIGWHCDLIMPAEGNWHAVWCVEGNPVQSVMEWRISTRTKDGDSAEAFGEQTLREQTLGVARKPGKR